LQALGVDRHRGEGRTRAGERAARADIAGVLDPGIIAGVEQHARGQIEPLLRAGDHHHLLGVAAHAARGAQVLGDLLAQRAVAGRLAVAQQLGRRAAPVARHQARPIGLREGLEGGQAGPKCARRACVARDRHRRSGQQRAAPRNLAGERAAGRGRLGDRGAQQVVGQRAADIGARAWLPADVALGQQLLVGAHHGVARDAQLAGQCAAGGQARAGYQPAGQNGRAHGLVELAVQRQRRGWVERDLQQAGVWAWHWLFLRNNSL
jgi:hypothetical protein